MSTATWDGNAMTQEDMMVKDTVLVLDEQDNVIGSASKRSSHEFTVGQPRAILHRAFSVFLFDESTGELLLQQRASSKITFPNVRWKKFALTMVFESTSTFSNLTPTPSSSLSLFRSGRIPAVLIHFMGWSHRR
jgi:hypothetical protein